jgi:hypothetical protein
MVIAFNHRADVAAAVEALKKRISEWLTAAKAASAKEA